MAEKNYFEGNKGSLTSMQEKTNNSTAMAGIVEYPGKFRCKVKEFLGKEKKEGKRYVAPSTYTSDKGNLMMNVVFEVVDGTARVPAGSLLFHLQTLLPNPQNEESKQQNTIRYMKAAVVALTGVEQIPITEEFFKSLTVDLDENWKVTRHHIMTKEVMCVVEESWNDVQKKFQYRVKYINRANNDKSIEGQRSKEAEEWFATQTTQEKPVEKKSEDIKEKVGKVNLDPVTDEEIVKMEDV
jgi:hypothetical protein